MANQTTPSIQIKDSNVGIGTTTPGYRLDVNGDINIVSSSVYRIGGNTILAGTTSVAVGSSGATGSVTLRTTSGDGLVLNGGNVGIGTTSPVSKLNINNGDAWINVTDTLRGLQFGFAGPSHGSYRAAVMGGAESYGGTDSGMLTFHTQNGYVVSAIPPERMRISSSGNVGIGTTVPSRLLTVSNPANGDVALFTNTVDADLLVNLTSGVTLLTPSTGTLAFGTSLTERMRITSAGNVGIGTTAPGAKLQINNGTGSDEFLRLSLAYDTSRSARGGINWHDTTNTTGRIYTEYDGSMVSMVFGSLYNSGYNSNNLMIIRGNGNVGIGTTSPITKLSIGAYSGSRLPYINATANTFDANGITVTSSNTANAAIGGGIDLTNNVHSVGSFSPLISFSALSQSGTYNNNYAAIYGILAGAGGDANWNTGHIVFATAESYGASEKMRITSAGDLLVGTTSSAYSNAGRGLIVANGSINSLFGWSVGGSSKGYMYHEGTNVYLENSVSGGSFNLVQVGAGYFSFNTNSAERMRITSAGSVGIGTTAPNNKLTIASTDPNTLSIYRDLDVNVVGAAGMYINMGARDGASFANGARLVGALNNPTTGAFYIDTLRSGTLTTAVTVLGSGNVGIGTTSPLSLLHVYGSNPRNLIQDAGAGHPYVQLSNSSGNFYLSIDNSAGTGFGSAYGRYLYSEGAYPMILVTNSAERMRITSDGNVGIGTTSPTQKLHVVGNTTITGVTYTDIVQTYSGASIDFRHQDASVVMRVDTANARVGIGTTSPSYKLDVSGDIRSTTIDLATQGVNVSGYGFLSQTLSGQMTFLGHNVRASSTVNNTAVVVNGGWISSLIKQYYSEGITFHTSTTEYSAGATYPLADTERMRITSAGNVGIGTTAPNIGGWSRAITLQGSANAAYEVTDGTVRLATFASASSIAGVSVETNHPLLLYTNSTERMRITAAGNVGINSTAASVFVLDVHSKDTAYNTRLYQPSTATDTYISLLVSGAMTSAIGYFGAGGSTTGNPSFRDNVVIGTQSAHPLVLNTSDAERMRITSAGNVGIGTTSPISKLTVLAASTGYSSDSQIKISDGSTSYYGGLSFDDSGATRLSIRNSYDGAGSVIGFGFGSSADKVQIIDGTGLIVNEGNVGIGTTSPSYKLHTVGDAYFTSFTGVGATPSSSWSFVVDALAGTDGAIKTTGSVLINTGALGVNITPSATAGRIDASNDIVAYSTSDERFKENITPIANALDKVKTLTGVEFDWKMETKDYHGYVGHDVGVIAQQVKAVLPEAVRTNANGYLAVRYEKMIALLVEANKELAARVELLESKLKQ